jgi:hypothetical protein
MLDFRYFLQTYISPKTGKLLGASTVFDYFLKTMVFLKTVESGSASLSRSHFAGQNRSREPAFTFGAIDSTALSI